MTSSGKDTITRRIADDRAGRLHEHCGWKKSDPRRANAPYKFRAWIFSEPRALRFMGWYCDPKAKHRDLSNREGFINVSVVSSLSSLLFPGEEGRIFPNDLSN
jgi:hypothetical protein